MAKKTRKRSRSRDRSSVRRLSAQPLESRQLLAGDVEIFTTPGGDLFVIGDRHDNSVEIRVESLGNIVAEGLNGTLVNGTEGPVTIAEGDTVRDDVRVNLGRGDDTILIEGLQINDDLYVHGGRGNDAIGLLRTTIGDDASIFGGSGSLEFSLDLSEVEDDLRVIGSRRNDTIVFDSSTVRDDTTVLTSSGDDTFIVLNSQHQDDVYVGTGRGDDFAAVIGTTIGDDVFASLGRGNDSLLIEDSSLGDRVIAFGGRGSDALELSGEVSLNQRRRPFIRSFEKTEVDRGTVVDDAIAQLVDTGVRRPTLVDIATGSPEFSILVSLVLQANLLDAINTDAERTIFAPDNDAFLAFLEEKNLELDDDGNLIISPELLDTVLKFHILDGTVDSGKVLASDSLETLSGESFTVDAANLQVDNNRANLIGIDIRARNGIIHVVDTVLTPAVLD